MSSILDELAEEGDVVMEPEEPVDNSEGLLKRTSNKLFLLACVMYFYP